MTTKISQIIKQDIKFRFLDDIAEKTEHPFGIRKTRRIHSTRSSGNILSNEYLKKKSLSYIYYWRKFCNILLNLQTKKPAIIVLIFILKENAMFGKMTIASPRMKVHSAHLIPKDWWDVSQEVYNCLKMYWLYDMKMFWSD